MDKSAETQVKSILQTKFAYDIMPLGKAKASVHMAQIKTPGLHSEGFVFG